MDRAVTMLIESSSTPLLHRVLEDARKLYTFSVEHNDAAGAAFFDTVIRLIEVEIIERRKP